MENKVVCYYCGTIYDNTRGKCPLCGSTARASESAAPRPSQRQRANREERRATSGARRSAEKRNDAAPKSVLTAALIFLVLTVLVVLYFIGDMIGWWPGLEDRLERENPLDAAAATDCDLLELNTERLEFAALGETSPLTVSVNLSCGEEVYCNSADPSVAAISQQAETAMGGETKSVTFTVTAVAEGETDIVLKCGEKTAVCRVVCTAEDSSPIPSMDENDRPELNTSEISLYQVGDTATLRVTNLPEGAEVIWRSADESVASVGSDGTVTAVSGGTTTITVEVDGKTAEATVRCVFENSTENCDGAHLEKTDVTVRVGERFDLYLYDSGGEHIDGATYTVRDPEICEVSDSYVTALAAGRTEVVVTYRGQEYVCIVRVTNP